MVPSMGTMERLYSPKINNIFAFPKIPKNMKYEIPNPKPTLDHYEPTYVGE